MTGRFAVPLAIMAVTLAPGACSGSSESAPPTSAPPAVTATTSVAPSTPVTTSSSPPTAPPTTALARVSVRVVSQNILHGQACPPETAACQLTERVGLFMQELVDAGCPEVVGVEEANIDVVAAIEPHRPTCGYHLVWDGADGIDRELILTTLDIVDSRRIELAGGFRTAYAARLDSPAGVFDVLTTHLASSSDNLPCDLTGCPAPCDASRPVQECQATQLVAAADGLGAPGMLTILGGDLNATPQEPTYQLVVAGGFVDSHLAAGQAECGPQAQESCTSGREDTSMVDLADPTSRQSERIDYLFVRSLPDRCGLGPATGLFHPGPEQGPIAYPSDHTGVLLELVCTPAGTTTPTAFPAPTSTVAPTTTTVDNPAVPSIIEAFETLFDGSEPDIERRLSFLEHGDQLRDAFLAVLEGAGDLATTSSVRVESVSLTSETTADVVFSVFLGDAVVFDKLTGTAVRVDGRWLVSASTFCALAKAFSPDAPGCSGS